VGEYEIERKKDKKRKEKGGKREKRGE